MGVPEKLDELKRHRPRCFPGQENVCLDRSVPPLNHYSAQSPALGKGLGFFLDGAITLHGIAGLSSSKCSRENGCKVLFLIWRTFFCVFS